MADPLKKSPFNSGTALGPRSVLETNPRGDLRFGRADQSGTPGVNASSGTQLYGSQAELGQLAANEALAAERREQEQLLIQKRRALDRAALEYKNPFFSGVNVGLYVGDQWVDNAISIDYNEVVNKTPVYGYFSTHFNAVSKGTTIVQGSLAIAFTESDYLGKVLRQYQVKEGRAVPERNDVAGDIEAAKRRFWQGDTVSDQESGLVPLQFNYRSGYTGQVGAGFNIRVFFGAGEFISQQGVLRPVGTIETITNVHLTSRGVAVMVNGQPIAEQYSFFARSVTTTRGSILRLIRQTDPQTAERVDLKSGR